MDATETVEVRGSRIEDEEFLKNILTASHRELFRDCGLSKLSDEELSKLTNLIDEATQDASD